jgi:hypothetical protein
MFPKTSAIRFVGCALVLGVSAAACGSDDAVRSQETPPPNGGAGASGAGGQGAGGAGGRSPDGGSSGAGGFGASSGGENGGGKGGGNGEIGGSGGDAGHSPVGGAAGGGGALPPAPTGPAVALDVSRAGDCAWSGPLPVGAPGKLTLFGRDAAGKYVVMPPDTVWTVGAGDAFVSARRSTGATVLVSGKSEGSGYVSVSAETPTGTLTALVAIEVGPALTAPELQGYVVPSEVPSFLSNGNWADQGGRLLLPVGSETEARLQFRGKSAAGTAHLCQLQSADLTAVELAGGDAVAVADAKVVGKKPGVGQVKTTLTLPGGTGTGSFVLSDTFDVTVTAELPTSSFRVSSEGGVSDAIIVHTGECRPYHLIETHGDPTTQFYYTTHSWTEAATTLSDPAAVTLGADGQICGQKAGASQLTVAFDGFTKTIPVSVWLPEGQVPVFRIEPTPVVIPDASNDGCVDVQVFVKLGDAPEIEISTSPDLYVTAEQPPTPDPADPNAVWATCSRAKDAGVRCCSTASTLSASAPKPSDTPMQLRATYLNGSSTATLVFGE